MVYHGIAWYPILLPLLIRPIQRRSIDLIFHVRPGLDSAESGSRPCAFQGLLDTYIHSFHGKSRGIAGLEACF